LPGAMCTVQEGYGNMVIRAEPRWWAQAGQGFIEQGASALFKRMADFVCQI